MTVLAGAFAVLVTAVLAPAVAVAVGAIGAALVRRHLRWSAQAPRLSREEIEDLAEPYHRPPSLPLRPPTTEGVMRPPMVRRPEKGE